MGKRNAKRNLEAKNRSKYKLEANQFDYLFERQGGLCAICRLRAATHVDHCHASTAVRGLLCAPCNGALGMLSDDPERLMRAAAYVAEGAVDLPEPIRVIYPAGREHKCGESNKCPGEEELRRLYCDENLMIREIIERLGIASAPAFYRYLEAHGIDKRGNTGRGGRPGRSHVCGRDNVCPGPKRLEEVYHSGLTVRGVVAELGLGSTSMLYAYLRAHDIDRREYWARARARNMPKGAVRHGAA